MSYNRKVEVSGVNTADFVVLKKDEAFQLFARAKQGDQQARQKLIQGNLRLVLSVIKRFENRNEPIDDLFQVGCIGLIKGIDNFNADLQLLPSTYLVPMIIGEIRRYLRDNSAMRVSRSMRDNAYRALTAREKLMNTLQREPMVEEIAAEIGLPREDVIFALDAISEPVSLYDPVFQDGGDAICVMDQVKDMVNNDDSWLDQISMKEAMNELSDREKRILALRFYDGKTQMEVAREIGISQAQVSRIEKGVLEKVKSRF